MMLMNAMLFKLLTSHELNAISQCLPPVRDRMVKRVPELDAINLYTRSSCTNTMSTVQQNQLLSAGRFITFIYKCIRCHINDFRRIFVISSVQLIVDECLKMYLITFTHYTGLLKKLVPLIDDFAESAFNNIPILFSAIFL